MSGPYGYGGYGGYAPPPGGYYPPGQQRPGYPPGQPPPPAGYQPQRPGYPPGQPPPAGYQPRAQFPQGGPAQNIYQQGPPGYGMPGYRPPTTQPQGYTPAAGPQGYGPPMVTQGQGPNVSSANTPMYTQPARQAPGPPMQRPQLTATVPQSFPELQTMSKEELEKLLESDTTLVEYFENREDVKRLQAARQKVVERNEELATANMSLKPDLETKQQELIELYSELESQRTELNDLQQQQQALADHYAPHNILARLKIAASEVEDESEAIAENFLNGDIVIDEFLKTYIPKKSLCHSRRAKEEKMERMGTGM